MHLQAKKKYGSEIKAMVGRCLYVVQAVKNVLPSTLTGLQRVKHGNMYTEMIQGWNHAEEEKKKITGQK